MLTFEPAGDVVILRDAELNYYREVTRDQFVSIASAFSAHCFIRLELHEAGIHQALLAARLKSPPHIPNDQDHPKDDG